MRNEPGRGSSPFDCAGPGLASRSRTLGFDSTRGSRRMYGLAQCSFATSHIGSLRPDKTAEARCKAGRANARLLVHEPQAHDPGLVPARRRLRLVLACTSGLGPPPNAPNGVKDRLTLRPLILVLGGSKMTSIERVPGHHERYLAGTSGEEWWCAMRHSPSRRVTSIVKRDGPGTGLPSCILVNS
jgi:hypothetical protein